MSSGLHRWSGTLRVTLLAVTFAFTLTHPRSRDQHTLLAARRPDPGLDDRPWSIHRPAARGTRHTRRRLYDRSGVLLDPVGDSRRRRTVVPESAACGRHRPGDSTVRRRRASARRGLASYAIRLDGDDDGRRAGHGRVRLVPVGARLEPGCRIDAGQGGNRPGLAGLAPQVSDACRAHRSAGVDRRARVYRRDLRRRERLHRPSRRSVRPGRSAHRRRATRGSSRPPSRSFSCRTSRIKCCIDSATARWAP